MNLNQLNRGSRTSDLMISKPTIIHLVPDFNENVYEMIHNSGIKLMNCSMLITKSRPLKLGGKMFNARKLYLAAKKELTAPDDKQKIIRVMQNIPKNIPKGKFIAIDHSITSQATKYITELTNTKRGLFFLFQQLKKEFKFIKTRFPQYENNIVFMFNNQEKTEDITMYDILKKLITVPVEELNKSFRAFDKFILCSFNLNNDSSSIFTISGIDKKGHFELHKNNLSFIPKLMIKSEQTISDLKSLKTVRGINNKAQTPLVKDISSAKVDSNVKIKNDKLENKIEINKRQLSKILRKYKIKDKTIGDNIKASIDEYVKNTPNFAEDDLEETILSAINLTIFGTTDIKEEYRSNPARLISKLEEVNTYSKDLNISNMKIDRIIDPGEVIDLNKITGLVRQEYEFSDNIHVNIKKLFKSLENRNDFPIKIVGFKHEYQDNNLNRVLNYKIKLKNQAGGDKEPYEVNVKVPAIVNDRYFKLNGKQYIISNQQFMVPITKTNPNECRLLTCYATLTLSIVNMKFNISQLEEIIQYMEERYSTIIDKVEKDHGKTVSISFKNGEVINLFKSPYYEGKGRKLVLIDNKLHIEKDGEQLPLNQGKSEYLFDRLVDQIQKINPEESFRKSSRSIPYIQLYIQGVKIPLIIYLWQQIGLINAFTKLSIDHEILKKDQESKQFNDLTVTFPLDDEQTLYIYNENERQRLISNGLLYINSKKFQYKKEDLNDKAAIEQFIQSTNGTRSTYNLDLNTENIIDPITKEILEFQDKPTSLISLINEEMIDKLLNDPTSDLTDLTIYRSRQAEIMFHLMYKQLMQAHNNYKNSVNLGDDESKLFLKENYIVECLLGVHLHSKGNSVLELVNTQSPVAELKSAAKLIKTGPGGIPGQRSFKKQHRGIHKTYMGNVGACATSEGANVGLVNHLTLNPLISNQYGSFGTKDITNSNGWDLVSLDEGLIPFINEMDPNRTFLAYQHRGQTSPSVHGEEPIVSSGAEFIVPQLASSKFIQRAKQSGKVISVEKDKYVEVEYKDGTKQFIDTTPRLASTKRACYFNLTLDSIKKGDTFKKDEPIAWTNNFNGDAYTGGVNLKIAVMNYLGSSHEDGYVISEEGSNKIELDIVNEISAIIPPNTKISKLINKIGTETKPGDSLIEFSYVGELEEYIDKYNIIDSESEEDEIALLNLINNSIKVKSTGGEVAQIRIYINNKNEVDPIIIELWNDITKDLKERQKLYSQHSKDQKSKLKAVDNLDMAQIRTSVHKHKGIKFEGAKISYFIKKTKNVQEGDKLANRYGAKGIITKVIDKDDTPYAETSGPIEIFLSPVSIIGRKNLAVLKEIYIGKIFFNFPKILKSKLNDKRTTTKSIKDLIISIYDVLDGDPKKKYTKSIKNKLSNLTDTKFRKLIGNDELKLNFIIEPFISIDMANIRDAAELLNIELEERVYIPELKTWTKTKVPVGISYYNSLEFFSEDSESLRATGGYVSLTGQPQKGRARMGGQSIGNMDIYDILTYDAPAILEEFMTMRSDDFSSKRIVTTDIIQNGKTQIPEKTGDAGTQNLYNIHMTAMGLRTE
jgi:DNA-directed RNA polymerase beta subunit